MTNERKICVAGIGGVGGLLAAMLGKVYGGQLTLVARGHRAEMLRENGLVLHSEFYGEVRARPQRICEDPADIGVQDIIFVCVKNYSLEQIAETIRPAVDEHTVIVPVLNGVEAGNRMRALFPEAVVGDAVIYTISGANPDGSVTQSGSYTHLFLGSKMPDRRFQEGVHMAYDLLVPTGFDVRWSQNIESEIWQKFILNCAFNITTARHQTTTGVIRENEQMRADLHALLSEAYQAGMAEGIDLPPDLVETKYSYVINNQPPNGTSSMKRDVDAGRPIELDAFTGTVIRLAEKHGFDVPVIRAYHEALERMVSAYSH